MGAFYDRDQELSLQFVDCSIRPDETIIRIPICSLSDVYLLLNLNVSFFILKSIIQLAFLFHIAGLYWRLDFGRIAFLYLCLCCKLTKKHYKS